MAGPKWNIVTPIETASGGTYWHKIGAGFENAKGITLEFNSLPLPNREGKVRVMLFENTDRDKPARPGYAASDAPRPRQDTYTAGGERVPIGEDLDDEIPF